MALDEVELKLDYEYIIEGKRMKVTQVFAKTSKRLVAFPTRRYEEFYEAQVTFTEVPYAAGQ